MESDVRMGIENRKLDVRTFLAERATASPKMIASRTSRVAKETDVRIQKAIAARVRKLVDAQKVSPVNQVSARKVSLVNDVLRKVIADQKEMVSNDVVQCPDSLACSTAIKTDESAKTNSIGCVKCSVNSTPTRTANSIPLSCLARLQELPMAVVLTERDARAETVLQKDDDPMDNHRAKVIVAPMHAARTQARRETVNVVLTQFVPVMVIVVLRQIVPVMVIVVLRQIVPVMVIVVLRRIVPVMVIVVLRRIVPATVNESPSRAQKAVPRVVKKRKTTSRATRLEPATN